MGLVFALLLALTPTYVIKVAVFGLPANLLMLVVGGVWVWFFLWLIKNNLVRRFIAEIFRLDKKLLTAIILFCSAGTLSLFVHGFDQKKLGEWIVLFLQPLSLFFILRFAVTKQPKIKYFILYTLYFLLAAAGLYAVVQYFTLLGLPPAWWGNSVEPKRAVSFFVHPNFYALWSAPLLAFLIPDVAQTLKTKLLNFKSTLWVVGAVGLLFSFSRAGWLGLAAAVIVFLIIVADKKIRKLALYVAIVVVVVIIAIPNVRWRILLPLYGEKSAVSRLSLWQTGIKAVKESPITGLGLSGFSNQWETLNTDAGLPDTHNFPHNIFLDFWVETGLLGLISFCVVAWLGIYEGFSSRNDQIKLGIALFLIAILVQGQIDNPYFKNDLALVFWLIIALL